MQGWKGRIQDKGHEKGKRRRDLKPIGSFDTPIVWRYWRARGAQKRFCRGNPFAALSGWKWPNRLILLDWIRSNMRGSKLFLVNLEKEKKNTHSFNTLQVHLTMESMKPPSPTVRYGACFVPFPKDFPCWLSAPSLMCSQLAGKKTISAAYRIHHWS